MENPNTTQQLITREQIPGTPFTMIHQEDKYFIVMGDYRITEPTLNKETQLIKLENEKWSILTNLIIIILEKSKELSKLANQSPINIE